jgi:hypothetical protein
MGRNRSNATAPAVKGNLVAGTGADTSGLLTVGADGTVLTADSAEATGIKWATLGGAGANWTLLNTGGTSLSGSSTTVSGISAKDKLMIVVRGASTDSGSNSQLNFIINGDTGTNYSYFGVLFGSGLTYTTPGEMKSIGQSNYNWGRLGGNAADTMTCSAIIDGANSTDLKVINAIAGPSGIGYSGGWVFSTQGLYSGTSVVTSIAITTNSGSFDAGTVFVYGSA